jgi:hypothetical protein
MDRRQVDHIEPEPRHRRQPLRRRAEGAGDPAAVLALLRALTAREELVPVADAGALALDAQRDALAHGRVRHERPRLHGLGQPWILEHRPLLRGGERGVGERGERVLHDRPLRCPFEQQPCGREHQLDVLAGGDLDLGVVEPRGPLVGEGADPPHPPPLGRHLGEGAPAVHAGCVDGRNHAVHGLLARRIGEQQLDPEFVVALPEDGRLERDHLAGIGLRRPARLGLLGGQEADRDASELCRRTPCLDISHHSTLAGIAVLTYGVAVRAHGTASVCTTPARP